MNVEPVSPLTVRSVAVHAGVIASDSGVAQARAIVEMARIRRQARRSPGGRVTDDRRRARDLAKLVERALESGGPQVLAVGVWDWLPSTQSCPIRLSTRRPWPASRG
jgi:hypothetical protein